MKRPVRQLLFWTPPVLGILFALDVFDKGYRFWGTLLALSIRVLTQGSGASLACR